MTPDQKKQLEDARAAAIARQGEVEEKEDELYMAASPKGRFSAKALNALVEATNRLLPLFGLEDAYPKFGSEMQTSLPPAFVRVLTMIGKAIDDAIAEGVLPEDTKVDLTIITDDAGLQGLAGRIGMAARSPGLKRFLKRKREDALVDGRDGDRIAEGVTEEMPAEGEGTDEEEMSEDKMNNLFAERM